MTVGLGRQLEDDAATGVGVVLALVEAAVIGCTVKIACGVECQSGGRLGAIGSGESMQHAFFPSRRNPREFEDHSTASVSQGSARVGQPTAESGAVQVSIVIHSQRGLRIGAVSSTGEGMKHSLLPMPCRILGKLKDNAAPTRRQAASRRRTIHIAGVIYDHGSVWITPVAAVAENVNQRFFPAIRRWRQLENGA